MSQAAVNFGQEVVRLRTALRWSVRELASRVNFSPAAVSRVERGVRVATEELAAALDSALEAGGGLVALASKAGEETYRYLPAVPTKFVGRSADIERLDEAALSTVGSETPTTVVVTGTPGVGKTALVLTWAHHRRGQFDEVLWADGRGFAAEVPASPGEILDALLRDAGLRPERIPAEDDERRALLRGQLQTRRTLVIVDNVRDERQILPVLPTTETTTVLLTSRRRLPGLSINAGATHLPIDPLDSLEASQLMVTLIGAERADTDPHALSVIVTLCASLPLAIRVAAERIAAHPHQSLHDLADELSAENRQLELLDIDATDLGVRAAFSWSYRALDDESARMFRLLALHPGPRCHLGALAALAGVSRDDASRLVDSLVQAHLVQQVGPGFFRFHDLLRVYAADEVGAERWRDERKSAVTRLACWYLHSAVAAARSLTPTRGHHLDPGEPPEGIDPQQFASFTEAYIWCVTEVPAVTGIARLARDYQLYDVAWQLPKALLDFHLLGRPWQVWIASHEIAVQAAELAENLEGVSWSLTSLAEPHRRRGNLELAANLYARAVALADQIGASPSLCWGLIGLGNVAHERGAYADAVRWIEQAVEVCAEIGYDFGATTAQVHLGRAYRGLGDAAKAFEHGRRALAAYTADADAHGIGYALVPLAVTARHFGDAHLSLDYCDQALAAYRESGDQWGQAAALDERGHALRHLGYENDALAAWEDALRLVENLDARKADSVRDNIATTLS